MATPGKPISYYFIISCLWILILLYAAGLLWQPEMKYGLFVLHIGSTGFAFQLNTFAPYILSFLVFVVTCFKLIGKSGRALLLLFFISGMINLFFSFILIYGYTSYPALGGLGDTYSAPRLLNFSLWMTRVLVLSVMFFVASRHWPQKSRRLA